MVINKADIYPEGTAQIEAVCLELGVEVIGSIPFDPAVTEAMIKGKPVTTYRPESPASEAVCVIWESVKGRLVGKGEN